MAQISESIRLIHVLPSADLAREKEQLTAAKNNIVLL